MSAPQLLVVEGAVCSGQAQSIPFGFERRSCQGYMKQGTLTVAQIGKRPLAASLIRMECEFDVPYEFFEPAFYKP